MSRPKSIWIISTSEVKELEKKWKGDQSKMTDLGIMIRTVELVMKERYGPQIEKMFDELEEKLDSAIGHHSKAAEDLNSMKGILDRYRIITDDC